MEVWILRGTDPETLEEKINKQLEEVEKVKSFFHTPTVQYQTAVVPQMRGDKVTVNKCGRNVLKIADVSPCLTARDYKGYAGKKDMIAVIEERKEQDNGKSQQPGLPNGGDA